MKNVPYYVSEYAYNFLIPGVYFKNRYIKLKELEKQYDVQEIAERVNYYAKVTKAFTLPEVNKVTIGNYKRIASASYFLDLKEFLHFFNKKCEFSYHFGDELHVNPYPTIFKARPLNKPNENSIIFKLDK